MFLQWLMDTWQSFKNWCSDVWHSIVGEPESPRRNGQDLEAQNTAFILQSTPRTGRPSITVTSPSSSPRRGRTDSFFLDLRAINITSLETLEEKIHRHETKGLPVSVTLDFIDSQLDAMKEAPHSPGDIIDFVTFLRTFKLKVGNQVREHDWRKNDLSLEGRINQLLPPLPPEHSTWTLQEKIKHYEQESNPLLVTHFIRVQLWYLDENVSKYRGEDIMAFVEFTKKQINEKKLSPPLLQQGERPIEEQLDSIIKGKAYSYKRAQETSERSVPPYQKKFIHFYFQNQENTYGGDFFTVNGLNVGMILANPKQYKSTEIDQFVSDLATSVSNEIKALSNPSRKSSTSTLKKMHSILQRYRHTLEILEQFYRQEQQFKAFRTPTLKMKKESVDLLEKLIELYHNIETLERQEQAYESQKEDAKQKCPDSPLPSPRRASSTPNLWQRAINTPASLTELLPGLMSEVEELRDEIETKNLALTKAIGEELKRKAPAEDPSAPACSTSIASLMAAESSDSDNHTTSNSDESSIDFSLSETEEESTSDESGGDPAPSERPSASYVPSLQQMQSPSNVPRLNLSSL